MTRRGHFGGRTRSAFLGLLAYSASVVGCASGPAAPAPAPTSAERASAENILHISWGGIALPDAGEAARHWSTWTINLVDGTTGYGWQSPETLAFPHELTFELAGNGAIAAVALDTRVEAVVREDGTTTTHTGAPIRSFAVLGSSAGVSGPFVPLVEGEAAQDQRTEVALPATARARWLKLVVKSNWHGSGATRLSEFEVLGALERRGDAATSDASGRYAHSYGPILLQQSGHEISGCYNDGLGRLRGLIFGRVMRLAWFSEKEQSLGTASLVAAGGRIYGFWYRAGDRMGSPWNAEKTSDLDGLDLNVCRDALVPNSAAAPAGPLSKG